MQYKFSFYMPEKNVYLLSFLHSALRVIFIRVVLIALVVILLILIFLITLTISNDIIAIPVVTADSSTLGIFTFNMYNISLLLVYNCMLSLVESVTFL